jgi:hypothetical protein
VIKTVLSQEREKHQAFSLPPSGIPQRDSKRVGVIFAWTTHPPNGRLHVKRSHVMEKKTNFFELCPSFLQHRPAAIALLLLVL